MHTLDSNATAPKRTKKQEIVLGGGAVRGLAHCGFLKALEEAKVNIGTITGVSIGSLIATFYANGYSPDQITEIFIEELTKLPPVSLTGALVLPERVNRLLGLKLGSGLVDLNALFAHFIKKYKLRPRRNLRIIAYNVLKRTPVVFEGCHYDLLTALSASCAIPLVMRPVWHGQKDLRSKLATIVDSLRGRNKGDHGVRVDGGLHHPYPADFCHGKAIIAKLGMASALPTRKLSKTEMFFHLVELMAAPLIDWYFPEPKGHMVIDIGLPDVACLTFALPRTKCLQLVDHAHRVTVEGLRPALARGAVPLTD